MYRHFIKILQNCLTEKKLVYDMLSCTFICNLIKETTISFTIHFFRFSVFLDGISSEVKKKNYIVKNNLTFLHELKLTFEFQSPTG